MLFVMMMLWSVTLVLLIADPRRPSIRWLGCVSFTGGAGALSAVLGDTILPGMAAGTVTHDALQRLETISSLVQYYGLPYSYFMFAVQYNAGSRLYAGRGLLTWLLLLPPAFTLLLVHPLYPVPFPIASLWAIPYVAAGSWIVFTKKEAAPALRRTHQATAWAIVPTVVLCTAFNYGFPLLGVYGMWRYNAWVITLAFVMFVVCIFRFGFLGIQFLFERRRLDNAFRAVMSGSSILNHAIKNDLGKMNLFADKLLAAALQAGNAEMERDVRVLQSSARHIQEMIHRVHQQTQEIVLQRGPVDLAQVTEELLQGMEPMLARYRLKTAYRVRPVIDGDSAHIAETVTNIVTNAIETMPQGGELDIRLFETRRSYYLRIKDSGPGMSKENLKRVLEPFYTTKSKMNFGLGLAYCYKVMQVHGGNLELESTPGEGTFVYLSFPKPKARGGEGGLPWN
jgi:signal transduction histidine kinase